MELLNQIIKANNENLIPGDKVLGVAGSPRKNGNSDVLVEQVLKGVKHENIQNGLIQLRDIQFQGCIGCEKCRKDKICTGLHDGMALIYSQIITSKGLVLVSPTHNYNITSWMTMFVNLWIMLFFVLTPFFALTMFLSLTENYEEAQRRKLALSVSIAVALIGLLLFFAGSQIFAIFGITLDSFRIGAGILLLLSGISLVQGKKTAMVGPAEEDIAVVPLAIPIIVGPATTGTILVMGAELTTIYTKAIGSLALFAAVASVGMILFAASFIEACSSVPEALPF
jgi:multiple antibiotic resistance protein